MSNIFENKGALAKTIVVAASNSLNQGQANYVCDGVNDEVEIQAALDALPATGGEVLLLDGTYNIEVLLVMDSHQTLRGCGYNTVFTTSSALSGVITAVGGAGTEKVGIIVADLRIDGASIAYAGIYWDYVDNSEVRNVWVHDCIGNMGVTEWGGIQLLNCDFDKLIGNRSYDNRLYGIQLGDLLGSAGPCTEILIEANTCQGNGEGGIWLYTSNNNTVTGNTCQGNPTGIYLDTSSNNTVTGNTCQGNGRDGISLDASSNNTVTGNTCTENSQTTTNTWDDISLDSSDYNNVQCNTCRAGALANKPRYGINVSNAACDGNVVIDNDLYNDGFGTAPFSDAGTGTKLNTYKVPFSNGSDPQDSGFLIDAAAEMARAWLRLPNKVVQVVRAKVYARSGVLEADHMRGEFVIYGGADNEAYNTHDGSVANHPTDSVNFAANDIIFWTIATAGLLAMVGGDSIEVKAIYELAGNGDCATNAYLRTVEIEYV